MLKKLDLPTIWHAADDSAEMYVGQKLGSATIGKWVMKAPFFHALLNMLPGLASVILLGHLIKYLEDDPDMTMVIDSPSSGHVKMMLESPQNFKEMFGLGLIVEDIDRMQRFMSAPGNMLTIVTCLATQMALAEGLELKDDLAKLRFGQIVTVVNDSYSKAFSNNQVSTDKLPVFISEKVKIEQTILEQNAGKFDALLPHYNGKLTLDYIDQAAADLKQLKLVNT